MLWIIISSIVIVAHIASAYCMGCCVQLSTYVSCSHVIVGHRIASASIYLGETFPFNVSRYLT